MSWIQTYQSKRFDFNSYTADDICLKDIAHALAYTCRFGGHCPRYYSVAQHSMLIADYFSRQGLDELADQALLHDATEAYVGDMVRPLKELIPAFSEYEDKLHAVINTKYGLPVTLDPRVKEADTRILITEKRALWHKGGLRWEMEDSIDPLPLRDPIRSLPPHEAFELFVDILEERFGYGN